MLCSDNSSYVHVNFMMSNGISCRVSKVISNTESTILFHFIQAIHTCTVLKIQVPSAMCNSSSLRCSCNDGLFDNLMYFKIFLFHSAHEIPRTSCGSSYGGLFLSAGFPTIKIVVTNTNVYYHTFIHNITCYVKIFQMRKLFQHLLH